MRYSFSTLSGARYLIDEDAMTWYRDGSKSNQSVVYGAGEGGKLFAVPTLVVGWRGSIQIGPDRYDCLNTTEVQRIELLDA